MAYANGELGMHAKIKVRVTRNVDGEEKTAIIDATYGRLIFNARIPQDLGYVDRSVDPFSLEIDFPTTSKKLKEIVDRTIKFHGFADAADVLDNIKSMGYKYSTKSSLSISVYDMTIPPKKKELLANAAKQVEEITELFNWGELSDDERYKQVIAVWNKTTDDVTQALVDNLDKYNSISADKTVKELFNDIRAGDYIRNHDSARGSAVLLTDYDILGDIDKSTGQVSGVRGTERGIRQGLT